MLDITECQRQYGRPCMRMHVLCRVLSRFERHSRGSPNGTQPNVATIVASKRHLKVYVQNFSCSFPLPRLAALMFGSFTTTSHAFVWNLLNLCPQTGLRCVFHPPSAIFTFAWNR